MWAKKFGCASKESMWKCTARDSASPCMPEPGAATRSSRILRITQGFRWEAKKPAVRFWSRCGRRRRPWKYVRWPLTRAWRWEGLDDSDRTAANFADQSGAESGRSSPGEPIGTGRQEGARLCRVPGRVAGLRSGCAPHALLAGAPATGPLSLREDFRAVRLRLSTFDRRKADPRVADLAFRARSQQRDSVGTAGRGQDALERGAGRSRESVWIRSVLHDRARSRYRSGPGVSRGPAGPGQGCGRASERF